MLEDGDRILNLVGAALVLALIASLGLLVVVASEGPATAAGPDTEWSLSRVNETHVRIAHAGGERTHASNLVVTVDGRERSVSWTGVLTRGDSGALHARSTQVIRLYWLPEDGNRELLARWQSS
ncbi:hypothetical protein ACFQJD_09900 [Haloplanus sp. GCM10025708]|uniref:hypothetical protein n=1 Tax=Haloferacaceae TaxID=1644056 RepID=UPI00361AADA0